MNNYEDIEFVVYSETKAAFENMVASGEIDATQIGLIGDTGEVWINGEFYPFAPNGAGNWGLTFNIQAPEEDATKYTIQQGDDVRLDILVPYINTNVDSFLTLTPTKTTMELGNGETEQVVSKLNITTKTKNVASATATDDGLATANDVRQELAKLAESSTGGGIASDLTGVIEPTSESFLFRPTAGRKSVRDASAVIRKIKGKTIVVEQQLTTAQDGAWTAFVQDNLTISYEGNGFRATVNEGVTISNPYELGVKTNLAQGCAPQHKYLFCAMVKASKVDSALGNNFLFEHDNDTYDLFPAVNVANKWTFVWGIWTKTGSSVRFSYIKPSWAYTGASAGDSFEVKDAMFFDLTAMFELGNEPTSIDDFQAVYPLPYYEYQAPTIKSMSIDAIKSVGFNAFNKSRASLGIINEDGTIGTSSQYYVDTIKVLPNTEYYLKDVCNGTNGITYALYDHSMRLIIAERISGQSKLNISTGITTTTDSVYLRVACYNTYLNQCCVNLRHSRVHDGEYKDYREEVFALPDIHKYFPDGMNGVGDLFDEITPDGAIRRFNKVRLGYLTWTYDGRRNIFSASLSSIENNRGNAIALCNNYRISNASYNLLQHEQISLIASGQIYLKDLNYTTVEDIQSKLNNTYLVYEVANEEYIPISTPIQLDYWVSDWGTEEALSDDISAIFHADIVYAFNAEGRIRDNERNIEVLEQRVSSIPYVIKSYTAYDFTQHQGALQMDTIHPDDLQFGALSQALREYRPVYMKIAPETEGFYGTVSMKYCYEEDMIYFSFFNPIDNNSYSVEVNSVGVNFNIE